MRVGVAPVDVVANDPVTIETNKAPERIADKQNLGVFGIVVYLSGVNEVVTDFLQVMRLLLGHCVSEPVFQCGGATFRAEARDQAETVIGGVIKRHL